MFICTGNILDTIPPALRDRLEVIRFPGYIEEEKLQIATQFLIPKQRKENGLTAEQVAITGEGLRKIVREYTREAGVRSLEREIASVFRKVATEIATGRATAVKVTAALLHRFLGPPRFRYGLAEQGDEVGTATGVVYSEMGGDGISGGATLVRGGGEVATTG